MFLGFPCGEASLFRSINAKVGKKHRTAKGINQFLALNYFIYRPKYITFTHQSITKHIYNMTILRNIFTIAALMPAALWGAEYSTTVNLPASLNGQMARLSNVDTEQPMDSVIVKDGKAVFPTDGTTSYLGALKVGDADVAWLLVGGVDVTMNVTDEGGTLRPTATTGGLNNDLNAFTNELNQTVNRYQAQQNNAMGDALNEELHELILQSTKQNITNPLGLYYIVSFGGDWLAADLEALVRDYPHITKYQKVNEQLFRQRNLKATQPGKKFTDFEVSYDGTTHKLSELVGHGDYVLVDFWASWCMPCRKEMRYIRKAQKEFEGKNLKIVGVAVWDEPENSLKAATDMGLTWPVWVNGTEATTNLYGISGIPCIILFGPDGTIIARDLHGDQILTTLAKHIK